MGDSSIWLLLILFFGAAMGWVCGFLSASGAHCDGCARSGHEVSRLTSVVAALERAVGNWMTRAQTAERRVEELWTEYYESEAKRNLSFAIISERTKAIDEAKAKCGPAFTGIVGTERDPVFLNRPNDRHDDTAWVSTVEELTGPGGYERPGE